MSETKRVRQAARYTVTAIAPSGAKKIMGRNLSAVRATKLSNEIKARGFDAEVTKGFVVFTLRD